KSDRQYILLLNRTDDDGKKFDLGDEFFSKVQEKISKKNKVSIPEIWGTLGTASDLPIDLQGSIQYSNEGSLDSKAGQSGKLTLTEIGLFRGCRTEEINIEKGSIKERFISFEGIDRKKLLKLGPIDLRLTLFLEKDEGAVVYFQYGDNKPEEPDIEYVLPEATKNFSCTERDRLHYILPIDEIMEGKPTLKILTGFRATQDDILAVGGKKKSEPDGILEKLQAHLFGSSHKLQLWNKSNHEFEEIEGTRLPDLTNGRTLFLIHGTVSNTNTAFKGLIEEGGASWLAEIENNYDNVIGFDHPTFSEGPVENIEAFFKMIGGAKTATVDIITHSRGALVGKHLSSVGKNFKIEKGALVAGANGVGYFTAGEDVAKFLKAMKKSNLGNLAFLKLIFGMAQFSTEWFLNLPGARAMTPGKDDLQDILNNIRKDPPTFLPIIGDYRADVGWFKAIGKRLIDLIIKIFLGKQHDWVVGVRAQRIVKPGVLPAGYKEVIHNALHTKYFGQSGVQNRIKDFLK
ncbi:MAG: hypothetical protein ABUK01_01155, partial [Leptospirales bacterium]